MNRFILMLALMLLPLRAHSDTGKDPAELLLTWQKALVYVPQNDGRPRRITTSDLPRFLQRIENPKLVLYAHGCTGITLIGKVAGKFYANKSYIFVAPDSFARRNKPTSCQPSKRKGLLHRAVLGWRHAEIEHSLARLRALPGLKNAPVALIGHSEGGIATATYKGSPVDARIIEGWTCHSGWPEYKGLTAPRRTPVLSLVGDDDPWFQQPERRGDCSAFMDGNDRSYVFRKPDRRHDKHWLSYQRPVRDIIVKFLARHM